MSLCTWIEATKLPAWTTTQRLSAYSSAQPSSDWPPRLFQHDFYLDATYLAGYAVECALKALVLRRTPRTRRGKMVAQLTEVGAKGHNVEYLKEQLKRQLGGRKRKDRDVLGSIADALRTATFWSTSLRYQVGVLPFDEARDFMRAARHIVDWCRRS